MKVAIFDVDGTLLDNKNHCVHASTVEAINKLRANGVIIVIATGRSYSRLINGVLDFIPDYVVAFSGHALVDKKGEYLFKRPFTKKEVKIISDYTDTNKIPFTYKSDDLRYCNAYFPKNYIQDPLTMKYVVEEIVYDESMSYLDKNIYFGAGLLSENEGLVLQDLLPNMHIYHMLDGWTDLTHKDIDKAETIGKLLKHLNVGWSDCIAFGDGLNDITFIKKAGIGVCMGNGYSQTKEIADYVCDDIDSDGIYKILVELKLIEA